MSGTKRASITVIAFAIAIVSVLYTVGILRGSTATASFASTDAPVGHVAKGSPAANANPATSTSTSELPSANVTTVPVKAGDHRVANNASDFCSTSAHSYWKWVDDEHYVVYNDVFYPGDTQCLYNANDGTNFTITKSTTTDGLQWYADPTILQGCWEKICTKNTPLPEPVSSITHLTEDIATNDRLRGGNDSDDFWFNQDGVATGQPNGDELMIWHDYQDFSLLSGYYVRIDGYLWHYRQGTENKFSTSWNYSQFVLMKSPGVQWNRGSFVGNQALNIVPFISFLERHGDIRSTWEAQSFNAGYEVTQGGTGTSTSLYRLNW